MEQNITLDDRAYLAYKTSIDLADEKQCEWITPEFFLHSLLLQASFTRAIARMDIDDETIIEMRRIIDEFIDDQPRRDEGDDDIQLSQQFLQMLHDAEENAAGADRTEVTVPMIASAMLDLEDSWAATVLSSGVDNRNSELIAELISSYEESMAATEEHTLEFDGDDFLVDELTDFLNDVTAIKHPETSKQQWHSMVTCINDLVDEHKPLIGRHTELDRTIEVLCRMDKNNPMHLGEPGVGKTALIYGLAARINRGEVPDALKAARIYELNIGDMLAGTKYRGDLEERLKTIMNGAAAQGNVIIYIDEIHNLVGAGQIEGSTQDASNMLKPYLEGSKIKFIGATTYKDFNRTIANNKALMRRFQTIDIDEPSIDEALKIIQGLKETYENFHKVTYTDDAIDMAVKASAKHITDRFLPDKAIDLIDEAGAWVNAHKLACRTIDRRLIAQVLARVARVNALEEKDDDSTRMLTLRERILGSVYGQDQAVNDVVEAVQMAKAGLLDPRKPLASLLFVGPTGVGKTEVARVLARELGVELVRFDMSEYMEKHAVAKLIGSPAGYVGYDDGGQLTDAVRRSPDCVLLLDEIEKAHEDIFNILLQVMDYGTLTDNKGNKAHFQQTIIIMTSNAGAQWARKSSVGFASTATAGASMLKAVKKTFKPEFINRLSGTVVFNDMSRDMASLILDKKLGELRTLLKARNVSLILLKPAREILLDEGFSSEYGAREMDRVIHNRLKTLLVREILFGGLKQGGTARVGARKGQLTITATPR